MQYLVDQLKRTPLATKSLCFVLGHNNIFQVPFAGGGGGGGVGSYIWDAAVLHLWGTCLGAIMPGTDEVSVVAVMFMSGNKILGIEFNLRRIQV